MNTDEEELKQITEKIIGCAYRVANVLGCGFIEKVYENALAHEMRKAGMDVEQQRPITVYYDGIVVGEYIADLLINRVVLVELKAGGPLDDIHTAQCLNYLTATGALICLLINFGKRVEVKRFIGKKSHRLEDAQ